MEPRRTIFDNDDSMLYKWAIYYKVPARYMVIVTSPEETLFQPMEPLVTSLYQQGYSPYQIFQYVRPLYPLEYSIEVPIAMMIATINPDVALINHYYRQLGIGVTVANLDDLRASLANYRVSYQEYLQEDQRTVERLNLLHQQLEQLTPTLATVLEKTSVTAQFNTLLGPSDRILGPIWQSQIDRGILEGEPLLPQQGLDIWNAGVLSPQVPFMRLGEVSKVYLNQLPDDLASIIPANIYGNMLTATLMVPENLGKLTSKTYTTVVVSLEHNLLEVLIPDTTEEGVFQRVISRITQALPIQLDNMREIRMTGHFSIYYFAYNTATLLDMIATVDLFKEYLFVDESEGLRDKFVIQYSSFSGSRPKSSVRATLTRGVVSERRDIALLNEQDQYAEYPVAPGTPYVTVNISYAETAEHAQEFMTVFRRLLTFYQDYQEELAGYYRERLHRDFLPVVQTTTKVPGASATFKEGLSHELSVVAPGIFVNGYARSCQKKYKPALIHPDHIAEWEAQTFTRGGKTYHRQVLPFPHVNPEIYLVCTSEEYPFPGVKQNNLSNKAEYPYIPCCYQVDQTTKAGNAYNVYYRGAELKTKTVRRHKMVTNKVLEYGRTGDLSKSILALLKEGLPEGELLRYGVNIGPNSFLHCVAVATDDPDYWRSEDKEAYIRELRTRLAGFHPNLLKQEFYDLTSEQIRQRILDTDSFFDPDLFYRLIEEAWNINVYVFYPPPNKANVPGGLELPRHRLFHVRPYRQRDTLIILRHHGGGVDALAQPQSELVIAKHGKKQQMIFGPEMGQVLFRALIQMNDIYNWIPVGDILHNHSNLYPLINYSEVFGPAQAQFIDPYGKLRALTFLREQELTVYFPPSQPLNLPLFNQPSRVDASVVVNYYGTPVARDRQQGLWYSLGDLQYGLYFPVTNLEALPEPLRTQMGLLPEGPLDPLFSADRQGSVTKIRLLKRMLRIILQYILWVFAIWQQESGESVDDFLERWVVVARSFEPGSRMSEALLHSSRTPRETPASDLDLYNLSNVQRILPQVDSVQQAMNYIQEVAPGLVREGRFFLPDRKTLVGIHYYLTQYLTNTRPEQRVPIKTIDGLYEETRDFFQQPEVAIFLNGTELDKWMNSVRLERSRITDIRFELKYDYSEGSQPYLYATPEGFIYLVQNSPSLAEAWQVSATWSAERVNPGYRVEPFEGSPPHVTYAISASGTLAILDDKRKGDTHFYQVLSYGEGRYAALLPLLTIS